MRDLKEGVKKAIETLSVGRELTERDKGMIEAGFMQCILQVTYDFGTCQESFISGMQELVRESQWHLESEKPNSDREVFVELENGFTIIATWMKGFKCWMSVNGVVEGVRYWHEKPERKK